jgi:hypothetical protein
MHTLHELLKNVVTHDGRHNMSTFRYGDAGFAYHAGDALPTPKVVEDLDNEQFWADVIDKECLEVTQKQQQCDACPNHSNCDMFTYTMCPNQTRVIDDQTHCFWRGTSDVNYEGVEYDTQLAPARPNNLLDWLDDHWDVQAYDFFAVSWAPLATFAVSRDAIRGYDKETYQLWRSELELGDKNGGMLVHYFERAFRSIFVYA